MEERQAWRYIKSNELINSSNHKICCSSWIVPLFIRLTMVAVLLVAQFNVVLIHPARADLGDVVQTIGDSISLGANTARELQEVIKVAGGETRQTLQQLMNDINLLTQTLSDKYQNNLDITIRSLDSFMQSQISMLLFLIDTVHNKLQEIIQQIGNVLDETIKKAINEAKDLMESASRKIEQILQEIEQHVKNMIIYGGEAAVYVINRATYDAILIFSILMLGIGLLLFVLLFYRWKIPSGPRRAFVVILMLSFLALFGSLTFVPTARAYVMVYTGLGLEGTLQEAIGPSIIKVVPEKITLGNTQNLEIWGNNLLPRNKTLTVNISESPVEVVAFSDRTVVVNVTNLDVQKDWASVVLMYDGKEGVRDTIEIIHPYTPPITPPITPTLTPDLVITEFTLVPTSVTLGSSVRCIITVSNQGNGPAGQFKVGWKPYSSIPAKELPVDGLNVNDSKTVSDFFITSEAGTFKSEATVDNEENKKKTFDFTVFQIIVTPTPHPVTPTPHPVTPRPGPRCKSGQTCCEPNPDGGCDLCITPPQVCP